MSSNKSKKITLIKTIGIWKNLKEHLKQWVHLELGSKLLMHKLMKALKKNQINLKKQKSN